MKLFIVRHGKAESGGQDDLRELSDRGISDVKDLGASLKKSSASWDVIWHSHKKRAVQTAQILAAAAGFSGPVLEMSGFTPEADPRNAAEKIDEFFLEHPKQNLMLVSHLPFVADFAAFLIGGPQRHFQFSTSSCLCLESEGNGAWQVVSFLNQK